MTCLWYHFGVVGVGAHVGIRGWGGVEWRWEVAWCKGGEEQEAEAEVKGMEETSRDLIQ